MPRYSAQDARRGNRTLLLVLVLLLSIIVAFIVAISAARNDPAELLTAEVDSLEKLRQEKAFSDPLDSALANDINPDEVKPTTAVETTPSQTPLPEATEAVAPKVSDKPKEMALTEEAKPVAAPATTTPAPAAAGEAANRNGAKLTGKIFPYKVRSGDNLSTISRKFNVFIDPIKKASNLTNDALALDQELKIPVQEVHTVTSGETLSAIAAKYGVKAEQIKKANNLNTDAVSTGSKLAIPLP